MDSAKIFLLRDHITLVQDLAKDWTSGPPVEMAYFVPFKYEFDIQLPNFQLYTYVNEHNIINEPTELDENGMLYAGYGRPSREIRDSITLTLLSLFMKAFIIAAGQTLSCKVVLPFVQYGPELTSISFDVEVCRRSVRQLGMGLLFLRANVILFGRS